MAIPTYIGCELAMQWPLSDYARGRLIQYVETSQHRKVAKMMFHHHIDLVWCRLSNANLYVARRLAGNITQIKVSTAAGGDEFHAQFRRPPLQPIFSWFRI